MSIKVSLETASIIKRFYSNRNRINFNTIYNRLSKSGIKPKQIKTIINIVFKQIEA
jgi:hypothetical protein